LEQHGTTYHHIDPKEELKRGMKVHYLSPDALGELEIMDIVDKNGKSLEKADCNMSDVYLHTSVQLNGRESLYVEPERK
jgi:hypothetical protein